MFKIIDINRISQDSNSNNLPTTPGFPNTTINWNYKLILAKDYKDFRIGAFEIDQNALKDLYIVTPIDQNDYPITSHNHQSIAFSYIDLSNHYGDLFDVDDENIYIINSWKYTIDVYTASHIQENDEDFYEMRYIESISGPKYKVGYPYMIEECKNSLCDLRTSLGCVMELNIKTKQYSEISCSNVAGEPIKPEPLY